MNLKRGLLRLWAFFSALWCLSLLGLATPNWYHAASYWYRSRGIEVTECKPWELRWQHAAPEQQQQSNQRAPVFDPSKPFTREAAPVFDPSKPYTVVPPLPHGLVQKPQGAEATGEPNAPASQWTPPASDKIVSPATDNPFAKYATPPSCFHVTTANSTKYLLDVANVSHWRIEDIRDVVLYNPELFPRVDKEKTQTPLRVDLTHGDPRPEMNGYTISSNVYDHPDLRFTVELTIAAFLVPFAMLVLGRAFWWVVVGFKT